MNTYSNPTTQAYVNDLQRDLDKRDERIASLRCASEQNRPQQRAAVKRIRISDLSPEEQSQVIYHTRNCNQ